MNYTLDTNILLAMFKREEVRTKIIKQFELDNIENQAIISVVSIGEMHALALKNNWGMRRRQLFANYFNNFHIINVQNNEIINHYALIDAFSQDKLPEKPLNSTARNMGKNDLWIAATAAVTKSTLLTTDKDFSHLDKIFFELALFEPKSLL